MKQKLTELVVWECKAQGIKPMGKVDLTYIWQEENRRRDKDNIMFGQKFIQDGLVNAGVLENDGWKQIGDVKHIFVVGDSYQVKIIMESRGL